jgi:hypothetical protein
MQQQGLVRQIPRVHSSEGVDAHVHYSGCIWLWGSAEVLVQAGADVNAAAKVTGQTCTQCAYGTWCRGGAHVKFTAHVCTATRRCQQCCSLLFCATWQGKQMS